MTKLTASERRAIEKELRQYEIVGGYITKIVKRREVTQQETRRAQLLQKFYLMNGVFYQQFLELRYLNSETRELKEMHRDLEIRYGTLLQMRDKVLIYLKEWFEEENCWDDIKPK